MREQLKHALRLRYGLAPTEPTDAQLDAIIRLLQPFARPTESQWLEAIYQVCSTAGTRAYASQDHSDLAEMLDAIRRGR